MTSVVEEQFLLSVTAPDDDALGHDVSDGSYIEPESKAAISAYAVERNVLRAVGIEPLSYEGIVKLSAVGRRTSDWIGPYRLRLMCHTQTLKALSSILPPVNTTTALYFNAP